ncbi:MAG TPA: NUDIX domain-containing protein [Candidatus Sulfotelmatobacter sp.]|nr:NUDIX domain-containing protein [Candidatus Sulfotelmatobacter sp.]
MLHEKSCGAVVFHKNAEVKYLLLRYEAGHWDFVKGNVEPNENEIDTVLRELKEETGIVATQTLDGFRERIQYFYRRQGETIQKEVVFYILQANTEKVELSFEHVGFAWLDYQHSLEKLTFKNAKNVLQKAHDFLETNKLI